MPEMDLLQPILSGGVRHTHFFNGRLLTAEDLATEQEANRRELLDLGRSVGEGVVQGLDVVLEPDVAGRPPQLRVEPGLGVNGEGRVLRLSQRQVVRLLRPSDEPVPGGCRGAFDVFGDCGSKSGAASFTGTGAYVLLLSPARGLEGQAPMAQRAQGGAISGCGSRYDVEGVEFRVEKMDWSTHPDPALVSALDTLATAEDRPDRSRFRNLLAHFCLGTPEVAAFTRNWTERMSFPETMKYGPIDRMRAALRMQAKDLPLALIYWDLGQVRFIDTWAVRRPCLSRDGDPLALAFSSRRLGESMAAHYQFRSHFDVLLSGGLGPGDGDLSRWFRFLPPLGFAPIRSTAHPRGVSSPDFFQGFRFGAAKSLEGSKLRALVNASLRYEPVDLEAHPVLQLYKIAENQQALAAGGPQEYWVFTAPSVPYMSAEGRFDGLCETVKGARDGYRSLMTRGVFTDGNETEIRVVVMVAMSSSGKSGAAATLEKWASLLYFRQLLLDVHSALGAQAIAACGCCGDPARALETMAEVYRVQSGFVAELLRLPAGQANAKARQIAGEIKARLDLDQGNGTLSLKSALGQKRLAEAIAAQARINGVLEHWTGGSAQGDLAVQYNGSVGNRGTVMVAGDDVAYEYRFLVVNGTDRVMDIRLQAKFVAPRESWNDGVSITDENGNALETLTLAPAFGKAEPPADAKRIVLVSIMAPGGAKTGESGELQFTASIPDPVSKFARESLSLSIGNETQPETPFRLSFVTGAPFGDGVDGWGRNEERSFRFPVQFDSLENSTVTRSFRVRVAVVPQSEADKYRVTLDTHPLAKDQAHAGEWISQAFDLTGQPPSVPSAIKDLFLNVTPLSNSGQVSITFRVESTIDTINVAHTLDINPH